MVETQTTIYKWKVNAHGKPTGVGELVARCNEEMAELITAHALGHSLNSEVADVLVTLYIAAEQAGINLMEEVDKKMAINRKRKWAKNKAGVFQHVEGT